MRLGYSILLQEFVPANMIEYGDCKDFQIVCPNCKEAIFKVNRGVDNEYLAHYKASKAQVRECELRVMHITKQEVAVQNAISQGQHLKLFQAVLRNALLDKAVSANWDRATLEKTIDFMSKRPVYRELVRFARNQVSKGNLDSIWAKHEAEWKDKSPYYQQTQLQFAKDMYEYMVAPNSFALFTFGMGLAIIISMGLLTRNEQKDNTVFHHVIGALISGSNNHLMRLDRKDVEHHAMLLATMIAASQSLRSWLVTLPYMDILRENVGNR